MSTLEPEPLSDISTEELIRTITERHPSEYYLLASRLFKEGRQDEAVFWYYAGQLRWRYYALANQDTVSGSEESSLVAAMHQSVGAVINEYAFGDLPKFRQTIDEVVRWDEEHPNPQVSKENPARAEVLEGLRALQQSTVDQAEDIRRTRTENGLENR